MNSAANFGVGPRWELCSCDKEWPKNCQFVEAAIPHVEITLFGFRAQQIMEAFPFDGAPQYLVRDNDGICGQVFQRRLVPTQNPPPWYSGEGLGEGFSDRLLAQLGSEDIPITPHSPWQNPYVERLIGSIRRECLNHVIVLNEAHLKRVLTEYLTFYHESRTHQALGNNAPLPREIEPPERGPVIAEPMVGGLHHRYFRRAG